MNTQHINQKGFVALMVVLVMSVVVMSVTVTLVQTGWNTRVAVLSGETKMMSRQLARACLERTIAGLLNDISFIGDATTTDSVGSCYVSAIDRSRDDSVIPVFIRASVSDNITILVVTLKRNDIRLNPIPVPTERMGTEQSSLTITQIREVPE